MPPFRAGFWGLLLAVGLGAAGTPEGRTADREFPRFDPHVLGVWGRRLGQTALADLDRDGDLDWVVGESGTMSWFEFRGPDEWVRHELGRGAQTDVGGTVLDVNGDGWPDVVAGNGWYENRRKPRRKTFKFHPNGVIRCHDELVADVDGDGKPDVVACGNAPAHCRVAWYAIPPDPRQPWVEHVVGPGIHGGVAPAGVGDLDGDGDADIVRGDVWFENLSGDGLHWREHPGLIPPGGNRGGPFGLARQSWVLDLDHDGDADLIQTESDLEDGRVFWFENRGRGTAWRCHLISRAATGQDFHSLAVADFDHDGDPDVFSGGGPLTRTLRGCFIWENADGRGGRWIRHTLLTGARCHEARAADVDGDGDVDLCTKPWEGSRHLFLENLLIPRRRSWDSFEEGGDSSLPVRW
jgi:hypothetical protein